MATQYPYDRSSRPSDGYTRSASQAQPGISRSGSRQGSYGGRPAGGQRPASRPSAQRGYGQRPSGSRYGQPSSGNRYDQRRPAPGGSRRPPSNGRRPQRRKPRGRFFAFLAVVLVVAVGLVILLNRRPHTPVDAPVDVPQTQNVETQLPSGGTDDKSLDLDQQPEETLAPTTYDSINAMLADTENEVVGLSADQMAKVEGLSINQSLPTEWLNVLLLGTDERTLSDSARTDAMMICSINRNTGEVKLTSIMRDLDVELKNIGKWSGNYRINAANYFGGPKLAIKTVNELFDMNIEYYVMVNFFGFSKVAQRLGGIEADITEAEKDIINKDIVRQYRAAIRAGVDESDQENTKLETFGPNTHLNGRQTLAYARIRHLDGGDYMRTQRQQTVLMKLMQKVKQMNPLQITTLAADMIGQVKTNMELNDILQVAITVAGNGIQDLKTFRLPVQGTYSSERRKNDSRLWDCDFPANAIKLYDFIYE